MKIALVFCCLILSGCDQVKSSARYQLVGGADHITWKIDTITGDVWTCYFSSVDMSGKKVSAGCFPVEQVPR